MKASQLREIFDNLERSGRQALADDLDPMTNLQGSAAMKLHLQRVLTGRALDEAVARARTK